MQFWPRKRSRHSLTRVRSWANVNQAKPLGFIGYKAGMTHLMVTDNRQKTLTHGEKIVIPSTIIDCPPMNVFGVCFYKKSMFGVKKFACVLAEKFDKNLGKRLPVPKKASKKFEDITKFDDLRLLVHSNPGKASLGTKKPKVLEIALGGSNEDKLAYAKEILGKEITVKDVFDNGNSVDVHGITKGKGFQGTVKRYGVPIMQHKAEKTKRGIGNLGAWTPKRVDYRVAQPGKMGFHSRTEYNKQIFRLGDSGEEITPKSGFNKYGIVKNNYLLIKGSVMGPRKSAILLTQSIRPNRKMTKDAAEISSVSMR